MEIIDALLRKAKNTRSNLIANGLLKSVEEISAILDDVNVLLMRNKEIINLPWPLSSAAKDFR